jgi:hypothetical protein
LRVGVTVWIIWRWRIVRRRRRRGVSMIAIWIMSIVLRRPGSSVSATIRISSDGGRLRVGRRGRQWMPQVHLVEVWLSFDMRQQLALIRLGPLHHSS